MQQVSDITTTQNLDLTQVDPGILMERMASLEDHVRNLETFKRMFFDNEEKLNAAQTVIRKLKTLQKQQDQNRPRLSPQAEMELTKLAIRFSEQRESVDTLRNTLQDDDDNPNRLAEALARIQVLERALAEMENSVVALQDELLIQAHPSTENTTTDSETVERNAALSNRLEELNSALAQKMYDQRQLHKIIGHFSSVLHTISQLKSSLPVEQVGQLVADAMSSMKQEGLVYLHTGEICRFLGYPKPACTPEDERLVKACIDTPFVEQPSHWIYNGANISLLINRKNGRSLDEILQPLPNSLLAIADHYLSMQNLMLRSQTSRQASTDPNIRANLIRAFADYQQQVSSITDDLTQQLKDSIPNLQLNADQDMYLNFLIAESAHQIEALSEQANGISEQLKKL